MNYPTEWSVIKRSALFIALALIIIIGIKSIEFVFNLLLIFLILTLVTIPVVDGIRPESGDFVIRNFHERKCPKLAFHSNSTSAGLNPVTSGVSPIPGVEDMSGVYICGAASILTERVIVPGQTPHRQNMLMGP